MDRAEYEQLCNEAFEQNKVKYRRRQVEKKRKPVRWVVAAFVVCAVLAVYLLNRPTEPAEIPKPVFLQMEGLWEGGFYGIDIYENRWQVAGEITNYYKGMGVWITFEGEPRQSDALTVGHKPVHYEVTADRCWNSLPDERGRYYSVLDICEFDIDRDGTPEECILSHGSTSGVVSFELSVWDGDTCENSVIIYSERSSVAFYSEDGNLKILEMASDYYEGRWHEHIYDIVYEDGELNLLQNGEPVDYLENPC